MWEILSSPKWSAAIREATDVKFLTQVEISLSSIMADCRTYFFCKIWQWNSTNLRIEGKSGHLNFSVQIIHDVYYGFNCDIEQIDMYDWTFTHERQLHVTLSPLGYLPWKSFMNWINICIIFCVHLCYSINNGTCIAFCAHSIVHKMCIIFVYIQLIMYFVCTQLIMYFVCTQLSMTPVIQFDFLLQRYNNIFWYYPSYITNTV